MQLMHETMQLLLSEDSTKERRQGSCSNRCFDGSSYNLTSKIVTVAVFAGAVAATSVLGGY